MKKAKASQLQKPEATTSEFGKWRTLLWPVHQWELKKLLPMLVIFFLLSFNYNILRNTKEVNIINASAAAAEVLPFIKVWVMLPGAFFLTYLFNRISERLSREHTFYVMVSIFLAYFALFTFVLYPYREHFELTQFSTWVQHYLPSGMRGLVTAIRFWPFTWFYAMSELWGSAILLVAFWGFANEVTRIEEAKRFYALFGIGANLSGIASSSLYIYFSHHQFNPSIPYGDDKWDQTQLMILLTVFCTSFLAVAVFRWLNQVVLKDPRFIPTHEPVKRKEETKKKRGSFIKDLTYLAYSPYMLSIAIIVLSFGFVINSVEVLWKNQVHLLYPNKVDYAVYMNQVTLIIGFISTFIALFVTGNAIRLSGWTIAANITPVVLLVTSIGFFGSIFFPEMCALSSPLTLFAGITPLALTVFFGTMQNCLSRACKYTFFDATKELAFLPLDRMTRLKGKSAIDGIISRLGKSGASVLYTFLLVFCGTLPACAPVIALCLLISICFWLLAVRYVGINFQKLTNEKAPSQEDSLLS